ncbi:MAG TPA: glucosaminidase domain-containing protein [Sporosarcina sp.]|nr:glucosaminidase domain-containing protein [Sporosarcina sp.]
MKKKRRKLKKSVVKGLFFIFFSLFLIAGGIYTLNWLFTSKQEPELVSDEPEEMTTEQFIGMIGEDARKLAHKHDLYASVMIAQAVLESNDGNSELASDPNYNLFGVKGHYKNESVAFETLEDDGKGNLETIVAEFRKYPSYKESLEDYAKLLKSGVSWDKQFYAPAYKSNTKSHKEATAYLTGTYATDSQYDEKLNALIKQYDLEIYDEPKPSQREVVVKRKDTLDEIAKSYNVSETLIRQWNQLNTNTLTKGQTLIIYEKK